MREWGHRQRGGGVDVKRKFVRYRSRCVWLLAQKPTRDLQPTDIQGYRFSGTGVLRESSTWRREGSLAEERGGGRVAKLRDRSESK
jgi:hypothetical protein